MGMIRHRLTLKSPLVIGAAVAAGLALLFLHRSYGSTILFSTRSLVAYAFAIAAGALLAFQMFYPVRKRWLIWFPGILSTWKATHVYIGFLAILLVGVHADFTFHWGAASAAFILLLALVGTGIWNLVLEAVIPASLAAYREELPELHQIDDRVRQAVSRLDAIAQKGSDHLRAAYQEESSQPFPKGLVRQLLRKAANPALGLMNNPRAQRIAARRVAAPPGEPEDGWDEMTRLLLERDELEAQRRAARSCRNQLHSCWVCHIGLAVAFVGLALVHMVSVLYY